jgi:Xaa-Pro aminopeptidase
MTTIETRIQKIRERLAAQKADALLVLISPNRYYLSGFNSEDHQYDESAGALLITAEKLILATDTRFEIQAQREAPLYQVVIYREGLSKLLPALVQELNIRELCFESIRVSVQLQQTLRAEFQAAQVPIELIPVEDWVEELRVTKSTEEIAKTAASLALAEEVFSDVVKRIRPGMTEKEVAWRMEKGMREAGAESLSFPSIIAAGPNSALPHAVPTDRRIRNGEPIIIDWGARLDGYCSDTTRTIILGEPDDTFLKVYNTVLQAQQRAIATIKAGINSKSVDAAAREYIREQGFAGKFGHGLGHGTGLAVHEAPRLNPVRDTILQSGMIVTVEPGIYLSEWGGVRIENQVVVEPDGPRVLNRLKTSYRPEELVL